MLNLGLSFLYHQDFLWDFECECFKNKILSKPVVCLCVSLSAFASLCAFSNVVGPTKSPVKDFPSFSFLRLTAGAMTSTPYELFQTTPHRRRQCFVSTTLVSFNWHRLYYDFAVLKTSYPICSIAPDMLTGQQVDKLPSPDSQEENWYKKVNRCRILLQMHK